MQLETGEARGRFALARVVRLATVTPQVRPHLVPIVFALDGDVLYTAVDGKPKTTTALRRLANITANPAVALLADEYAEDWTQLWWVRADGMARVADERQARRGLRLLTARYPVYRDQPPPGPVVVVSVARWTGWAGAE